MSLAYSQAAAGADAKGAAPCGARPRTEDRLSIVTTTHLIPSAPSVWILRKTVRSLRSHMGVERCRHLVYYDAPTQPSRRHERYLANLEKLGRDHGLTILVRPGSGLKANYLEGLRSVSTPYLLFLEHDWTFRVHVDIGRLLDVFDRYGFVNIVRFSRVGNDRQHAWDHLVEPEDDIADLPLTRTSGWSNNPHVVRVEKWLRDWLPIVGPEAATRSYGLEEKLYWAYGKDIFGTSFREAYARWGSCLYGPLHSGPAVRHINGSGSASFLIEPFCKAGRLLKRIVRGRSGD